MNLYQAEGIECQVEGDEWESDDEAEDYDAVEFLDDYKDHDWTSGWNDQKFNNSKLKVKHLKIFKVPYKYFTEYLFYALRNKGIS